MSHSAAFKVSLTKYGLVKNNVFPLTQPYCISGNYDKENSHKSVSTKYGLVGSYLFPTHDFTCNVLKLASYVKLYRCTKFIPHTFVLFSTEKFITLYKLESLSPSINLYLYSCNYGEDTISNHIVEYYLFPWRCRIRHWQGTWGMYCTVLASQCFMLNYEGNIE